jgi:hypothetical protein
VLKEFTTYSEIFRPRRRSKVPTSDSIVSGEVLGFDQASRFLLVGVFWTVYFPAGETRDGEKSSERHARPEDSHRSVDAGLARA